MAVQALKRASSRRNGLVARPALVSRLQNARDAALALIVAPAGYGKSTLLAEWAQSDERPFVWIRLDARDRDPVVLVASLAGAVQEAAQAAAQGAFVLVLDDAQAVAPGVLEAAVMSLLEQLRPGSQIAVASRTEPPLPIGRLRAQRALVEVRTGELAMSPAEAATLLRFAGLELDFASVQELSARTEGWPVGLYLAALAVRGQEDLADGVSNFRGSDHLIAEYFRDEFLDGLSPELARFAMRTSVLDELSGPLCDAVLEEDGSARTLAELAALNLMLVPVDRAHERFRWHGLLAATLRAGLRRSESQLEPALHSRASVWLRRRGDTPGAITHAIAAADGPAAGELLWANLACYLGSGQHELVQDWLDGLGREQIAAHGRLALAAAHTSLMGGDVDRARDWALVAIEASDGEASPMDRGLEAGVAIIEAAACRSGAHEMARTATRAYRLEPDHSRWRPICCLLRGVAAHLAGDRQGARRLLEEGVEGSVPGVPIINSLCLAQLALIAIEQDDWDDAGELAERAAAIVEPRLLNACPLSALVFAAAAATRARQGRIDEAKRDLGHATNLLAALGDFIPWYGAEARIMLARAALGLADTVRARTLLAEASRLARRTREAVIFKHCFDQAWAQIDSLAESSLSGPSSLTIAELRILRFLPSHRSFKEIAELLDVSVNTVKTQAHAIYRKLDAVSRSEAVRRASRAGLLGS
ncbi:MAG TPA: LuxR C-terminal-related transcriptional regulator [Solirubrobacteraceae bacterium]